MSKENQVIELTQDSTESPIGIVQPLDSLSLALVGGGETPALL